METIDFELREDLLVSGVLGFVRSIFSGLYVLFVSLMAVFGLENKRMPSVVSSWLFSFSQPFFYETDVVLRDDVVKETSTQVVGSLDLEELKKKSSFIVSMSTLVGRSQYSLMKIPTGSGKSTLLPYLLLRRFRRVFVLVPRRVLADNLTDTMSLSVGLEFKGVVGEITGLVNSVTDKTRLFYCTYDSFRKMAQSCDSQDIVLCDEAHEVTPTIVELVRGGFSFKLACMSATLPFGTYFSEFGDIQFDKYESEQNIKFHVDEVWGDAKSMRAKPSSWVLKTLETDIFTKPPCRTLVILPGAFEVRKVAGMLSGKKGVRVFEMGRRFRAYTVDDINKFQVDQVHEVIVSTSVLAEGTTIVGLSNVLDSGLRRGSVFHLPYLADELYNRPMTDVEYKQIVGRLGRTRPGVIRFQMTKDFMNVVPGRLKVLSYTNSDSVRLYLASVKGGYTSKLSIKYVNKYSRFCDRLGLVRAGALTELGDKVFKADLKARESVMFTQGVKHNRIKEAINLISLLRYVSDEFVGDDPLLVTFLSYCEEPKYNVMLQSLCSSLGYQNFMILDATPQDLQSFMALMMESPAFSARMDLDGDLKFLGQPLNVPFYGNQFFIGRIVKSVRGVQTLSQQMFSSEHSLLFMRK